MSQKWLKNDSKMTQKWGLESLLSHFWVTLGSVCPSHFWVTFESLLGHFNIFWVSVDLLGERWLPKGFSKWGFPTLSFLSWLFWTTTRKDHPKNKDSLSLPNTIIGKDQKGFHRRGIHDQGNFYQNLWKTTVQNALKMRRSDLFMDTPFVDTPFGPARHKNPWTRKNAQKTRNSFPSKTRKWRTEHVRDIPPKSLVSLCFEGHAELFGPHPFTWKTPTPPEISGTESLGLGSFFFPECSHNVSQDFKCMRLYSDFNEDIP